MNLRSDIARVPIAFAGAVIVTLSIIPVGHCIGLSIGLSTMGTCSSSIRGYLFFGGIVAAPASILFGIPIYVTFSKLGWLSWWQVTIGATSAAILAAVVIHLLDGTISLLDKMLMFGGFGAITGFIFWCFGLRHSAP